MRLSRRVWRVALAVILIGAVAGGAFWGYQRLAARRGGVRYVTRPVGYADIAAVVNETGTVNPVDPPGLVQVGSQVSGTIDSIKADYNSRVTKGQVLATLDPTTFRAAVAQSSASFQAAQAAAAAAESTVRQNQAGVESAAANLRSAQANVVKAQAQVALANLTVSRDESLLRQGFIPQNQMDTDQTAAAAAEEDYRAAQAAAGAAQAQVGAAASQLQSAQAQAAAAQHQVAAAQAQLQTAQYNLTRTVITSPMDGIVMARNISVGQTVAASFQTPTLFTLATNLSNMQVDTSVDEADVGGVKVGQQAQITVTAFPNVTFTGVVNAVRLNPTVVQNVVTYDAVVLVHDPQERLRPGMTAQVSIDVAKETHVLAVPIAALLYRPLAPGGGAGAASGGGLGPLGGGFAPPAAGTPTAAPVAGAPGSRVTVWVLANGRPSPVRVVIGLSDGQNVEITGGTLKEGDRVIVSQVRGGARSGQGGPAGGPSGGGSPGQGR